MGLREDMEITLVRNAAPSVPPLSEAGRHAVRVRLRRAAVRRRRRRLLLGVVLPAASALAVAAVVVAAFIVVPSVKDDAPPATGKGFVPATADAAILLRAAKEVRTAEKRGTGLPIPRPDQYVYTRDVLWEYPRDGGRKLVFPNESWRSVDGRKKSLIGERHNVMVEPARKRGRSTWPPTEYAKLRALPIDPQKLIEAGLGPYGRHGEPVPPLEKMKPREVDDVYMFLVGLIRKTGGTPPGLRPAAFEALARIPGVRVDTTAKDILRRPAISITRKMSAPFMGQDYRVLFHSRSYAYLGFRQASTIENSSVVHRFALVEWGVTDRLERRPDRLIKP